MKGVREPETLEQALDLYIRAVREDLGERRRHIDGIPEGSEDTAESSQLIYVTAGVLATLSFLCLLVGRFLPVAEETARGLEMMRLADLESLPANAPGVPRITWN